MSVKTAYLFLHLLTTAATLTKKIRKELTSDIENIAEIN
jgi:hypothetical protein